MMLLGLLILLVISKSKQIEDDSPIELSLVDLEQYPRSRSVTDIVWSCVSVMIACTWISVHPNIPSVRDHPLVVVRRKLGIMLSALMAPDLVVWWAARQWIGARKIAERYNRNVYKGHGPKWTKTHGFFLLMGGLAREKLIHGQPRIVPISASDFDTYLNKGIIDFPDITEEEIQDRSKRDWLAKSIIIFQTTWFILQCIARGVDRNLRLTELEIVTLALASLNAAMYFFWWNKPLDVFRPIKIVLKKLPEGDEAPTGNTTERAPMASDPLSFSDVGKKLKQMPRVLYQLPFKIFRSIGQLINCCSLGNMDERVPTFYAPQGMAGISDFLLIVVLSLGLGFGAIHFAAWTLTGPTNIELQLWRISSVLITATFALPLILGTVGSIILTFFKTYKRAQDRMALISAILFLIAVPFYIIARLIIFGLAIASLRNLTLEAYIEINWTTYIPHFG